MKQIKSFLTLARRLRNAEHFDFFDIAVKRLGELGLKPASLIPLLNTLVAHFDNEDVIYKRYLRQNDTKAVVDANEERKRSHLLIKYLVEMNRYSKDAARVQAAEALTKIMDNFADISRAPMTEVTALITNMVQDLKQPKLEPAVTLLDAADAIEQLRVDNETFLRLYYERAEGQEDERDEGSLREARTLVDQAFMNLTEAINVFYKVNEQQHPKDPEISASLEEIIHVINSYIHQYEAIYTRRNPKYHPSGDEPSTDTPSGEPDDTTPTLTIASQAVKGTGSNASLAPVMTLTAADPAAFAAALYPGAQDAAVKIKHSYGSNYDLYPVIGFLTDADAATPIGLEVGPPDANTEFTKPFKGFDIDEPAQVLKDDTLLALLEGVQYPSSMTIY
jgi:hypothetical protein